MNVQIISGREVTRPSTTPLTSSILDHATVVDNPQFGLVNNEGLWPSYNCLDTAIPTAMCPDPLGTSGPDAGPKVFAFAGWQPAWQFAIHGGVQCSLIGLDIEDQKSELERVFRLNEGKAVEAALAGTRFVVASGGAVEWDAPVDVSGGGTGTQAVLIALAMLEGAAAKVYAGQPTIHMPRAAGTILEAAGAIVWQGSKAFTKNGSKVAMGGGYDSDPDDVSGDWDLFATGEVYIERARFNPVRQAETRPGFIAEQAADPDYDEGDDDNLLTDNTSLALVEQMYRVAVDCFVFKATASVF